MPEPEPIDWTKHAVYPKERSRKRKSAGARRGHRSTSLCTDASDDEISKATSGCLDLEDDTSKSTDTSDAKPGSMVSFCFCFSFLGLEVVLFALLLSSVRVMVVGFAILRCVPASL